MNRSGAPTYSIHKIKKLNGFWPLYFGGALFSLFQTLFQTCGAPAKPVVPLISRWCR